MQRAIINIISTACEAMQDANDFGKIKPGSRIEISTCAGEQGKQIRVNDSGPGIPDELLPRIFEPLYSTKTFGAGLGMPIVRQIVQRHGGTLDVRTVAGEGTLVAIVLSAGK